MLGTAGMASKQADLDVHTPHIPGRVSVAGVPWKSDSVDFVYVCVYGYFIWVTCFTQKEVFCCLDFGRSDVFHSIHSLKWSARLGNEP